MRCYGERESVAMGLFFGGRRDSWSWIVFLEKNVLFRLYLLRCYGDGWVGDDDVCGILGRFESFM